MARILEGIEPFDPVTFVTVPLVLGAVALIACAVAVRRAPRIEPLAALKAEYQPLGIGRWALVVSGW
jgi:hypothetical protein